MTDLNIIVRTADQARKAEVAVSGSQTGGDVIQAAVDNWSLPGDIDYSLVNTRTAKPVQPAGSLNSQDVKDGDVLEIQAATAEAPPGKPLLRWTDTSQSAPAAPPVSRVISICPNCKASLRVAAGRSDLVSCPFCNKKFDSAT